MPQKNPLQPPPTTTSISMIIREKRFSCDANVKYLRSRIYLSSDIPQHCYTFHVCLSLLASAVREWERKKLLKVKEWNICVYSYCEWAECLIQMGNFRWQIYCLTQTLIPPHGDVYGWEKRSATNMRDGVEEEIKSNSIAHIFFVCWKVTREKWEREGGRSI